MSGGSHIRAIGPGSGAQAPDDGAQQGDEPLTLDESWAEEPVYDEAWENPAPRRWGALLAPVGALLAVGGWTAFFAWAADSHAPQV